MKCLNEGVRALTLWVGTQFDIIKTTNENTQKIKAENIIALMTPVLKSFSTDLGFESANQSLQIYGGHGYVKDHGMEQLVRDSRIAPIYEGTNGIQALDLIGRKMNFNKGEIINTFFDLLNDFLLEVSSYPNPEYQKLVNQFKISFDDLILTVNHFKTIDTDESNGAAVEFLNMFSYVSIGYVWLKMLKISLKNSEKESNYFLSTKIATGKYYFNKVLPKTTYLKNHIFSGASIYNDYKDDYFESSFK